jgi:hypothetical protein
MVTFIADRRMLVAKPIKINDSEFYQRLTFSLSVKGYND